MDTSKKYIEMARATEEIQFKLNYLDGVGIVYLDTDGYVQYTGYVDSYYKTHGCDCGTEEPLDVWLPTQHHLQDMVMPEYEIFGCDAIEHFMDDLHIFQKEHNPLYDSMEKLTLAFVMYNLYNKKWAGTEWVI